ncbi:MAG: hypothetical protein IPP94_00155 [Ignavibacteria bacterium]|nr:hypothetical protein [Ignavibacteria bacterium]
MLVRALFLLLLAFPALRAQHDDRPSGATEAMERSALRAELRGDVAPSVRSGSAAGIAPWESGDAGSGRKSPYLAAALSLVIPGAGEVYAGSYWTALLFAGFEATGILLNVSYNRKGDDQTGVFERYADQHWSLVKYAQWLNDNAKTFPGGENTKPITINSDESLPPWERVNWDELHAVESAVPVFSHRLPPHGDQQYYELIGKYNQYSFGWEDKLDGPYNVISPRFDAYRNMRGEANSFYNTATMWINLVILNHILSAVDAVWATARFNKHVELHSSLRMHMLPGGVAEVAPTATFRVHL